MKKFFIMAIALWGLMGCSNFLEEYSQDLSKVESYADLDEVLLGEGYLPVGGVEDEGFGGLSNTYFQTIHYMSDELTVFSLDGGGDELGIQEKMFGWHTWQQEVGLNEKGNSKVAEDEDFHEAYHCINTCNMVMDGIDEQSAENEEQERDKARIKGEAAFLRGLYYFVLANLYGKPYCEANLSSPAVPLKLSPVVEDKEYTCNTVAEVYEQVLADLNLADTCLVNAPVKNFPYRADITAVYLLKSRVYLYMQNWEKALEYAEKVMNRKNTLLDLNNFSSSRGEVLSKSSPETIFSMGGHTLSASIYGAGSWMGDIPAYTVSDDLAEAFIEGDNDLRTKYYVAYEEVGGGYAFYGTKNEWIFKKMDGKEYVKKEVSDNFLFRVAEAYLNGAEAAAMLGDETTARALLKKLRDNRLVESAEITATGEELINLIRTERQCELCLEGHRWFDLRRYMVDSKYPFTKEIIHRYTRFDNVFDPSYPNYYKLEKNDPAYTLALPREVLEFQNTLGTNHRPVRAVLSRETEDETM